MFEISLFGRGGQGIVTTASLLADAALREGRYPQKMAFYGAARRGDIVRAYVRIDSVPVLARTPILEPDCVVVADPTIALSLACAGLKTRGLLVLNDPGSAAEARRMEVETRCVVDGTGISREVFGDLAIPLTGIVMLGALLAARSLVAMASVSAAIDAHFRGAVRDQNLRALQEGSSRAAVHRSPLHERAPTHVLAPPRWDQAGLLPFGELPAAPVFLPSDLPDMKTGLWRTRTPSVDPARCRACGRCLAICPEEALSCDGDTLLIDADHCKGCGICARECSQHALTIIEERP